MTTTLDKPKPKPSKPARDKDTLVDDYVLFPKGNQTAVEMTKGDAPKPCPAGDIINPFDVFPEPAPGTVRAYRLKAVYYDENANGSNHVRIRFHMFDAPAEIPVLTLPQVASAQGASNFRYSDWFKPAQIPRGHGRVEAYFDSQASWPNHAGVYSLVLEAHDLPKRS